MNKFLIASITFLFFSIVSQGQNNNSKGTIKGHIKDTNGEPAAFVNIGIENTTLGTLSDEAGNFKFEVPEGKYTLVIVATGHAPQKKAIEVKAGKTTNIPQFKLEEAAKELQEVQITGKTEVQEIKESAFTVNSIDTKQFANTTADLNTVLNRSTGIKVRETGGTGSDFNFSINGLSGKAIKYFVDGIPMDVMGSSMTLNNVPVNLAERVDVYKGVVPVTLGADAMGGAVNVITNQKIKNYFDASYSFGSFNTHRVALSAQAAHEKTGLILRTNAFYNYSDNNYMMKGMEIYDSLISKTSYVKKDFRRFHDKFQSVMGQIELGVMNKKWADVFFIGGTYTSTKQDVQTGTRQDNPFGDLTRQAYAYNSSIRWRKDNFLVKNLNANAFVSYTYDTYLTVDTSGNKYQWDGSYVHSGTYELQGEKTLTRLTRPKYFARTNFSYNLAKNHALNLNYTFDKVQNNNFNELKTNKDNAPGVLSKNIIGLAYQQNILNQRLSNTFFVKYYGLGLAIPVSVAATGERSSQKSYTGNYGYGIASRYLILKDLGIKASYEYAYRLQEVGEVFGNGMNIVTNTNLKPEHSNNVNAGLYYGKQLGRHRLFIEGGAFYRNIKDFIYTVVYSSYLNITKFENTSNVRVTGGEGEIRYEYNRLLTLTVNASYQNAINTTKNSQGSTETEATYLNKVPNQPWVFGNLDLGLGKNDLFGKNTRIQFNWSTQYTHWFFLTWEGYGNPKRKNKIPTQWIHNASVSYSLANGKYNVSLECRNLTDALAYDNFLLQKPGRSFSIKLRYFLK